MRNAEKLTILCFKDVRFKHLFYVHLVGDSLRDDAEVNQARTLWALAGALRALASRPLWCYPRGFRKLGVLGW